ncbi:MAG: hypothetical protein AAF899_16455 [Pseudomonadota bacterium]
MRPTHSALKLAGLGAGLAAGLAACAAPEPTGPTDVSGFPPPVNPRVEPIVELELMRPTAEAKPFIEEVAARCWLDGVVQADAMLVDRNTGKIVMTGETDNLLVIDFLPVTDPGLARMRLTGPVLTNTSMTERLLGHLERAQEDGEIDCPVAASPGKDSPIVADG